MRRIVVIGVAGLVLLGSGSISRPDASSAPMQFEAKSPRGPLLGIVGQNGGQQLARIGRHSLRPLAGRRIPVSGWSNWAFSPKRSKVVVARIREARTLPHASLRFVDVRRMRTLGDVALGAGGVDWLAWLSPERVVALQRVCCSGTFELVVVAPRSRRILERSTLDGEPVHGASTRDELVVLVAPPSGIGPSQLLVVDRMGLTRSVGLASVWAGRNAPGDTTEPFVAKHQYPGLTVDPDGRRAFVASTDGSVAAVDLRSLEVAYHRPAAPRSLLGRVLDWLEPDAYAKASQGPARQATWLGSVLIAVTGSDDQTFLNGEGALSMRTDPAGLTLIDTNSWTAQRIDDSVSHVTKAGNLLLASGYSWDSSAQRAGGIGLAGYAFDGTKRFHVFKDRNLTQLRSYGSRAYVGFEGIVHAGATYVRLDDGSAFKTIDLATGRVVGTRTTPLPTLLVDGS